MRAVVSLFYIVSGTLNVLKLQLDGKERKKERNKEESALMAR
jgi:hypothetical protein